MNKTTAHLLFVGTELLKGKENKYPPLFCSEFAKMGIEVTCETSLPDNVNLIAREVKNACKNADIVLIVGGLGPTFDDVTRQAVSKALGRKLVLSQKILIQIKNRFEKYRRPMSENNKKQAYLLDGAVAIPNSVGIAPGQYFEMMHKCRCGKPRTTRGSGRQRNMQTKKFIVLLPGPHAEWQPMFTKTIKPQITEFFKLKTKTRTLTLKITDIGESGAEELLTPVIKKYAKIASFTILASPGDIKFNMSLLESPKGLTKQSGREVLSQIKKDCKKILGNKIYGTNDDTLEKVVGRLLKKQGLTLAIAESCTGGLISHKITQVAGSSAYFKGAIVAYSNELKQKLLSVETETLKKYGAVSSQTVLEMAKGVIKKLGCDCALAVTGIAGPEGGKKSKPYNVIAGRSERSDEAISLKNKPVGLVYIALIIKGKKPICKKYLFSGTRSIIKTRAANAALDMLRVSLSR